MTNFRTDPSSRFSAFKPRNLVINEAHNRPMRSCVRILMSGQTCSPQNLGQNNYRLYLYKKKRLLQLLQCMLSREKEPSQGASIPVQIYSYFYSISTPLDFYTVDSTSGRKLLVTGWLVWCLCLDVTDKPLLSKISNPFCKVLQANLTKN